MDKFEKNNNLMRGKGEQDIQWITAKGAHIPIKDGESKQEAIDNFINDRQKQEAVQSLVNVLKNASYVKSNNNSSNIKTKLSNKQLVDKIMSFQPIELQIGDRTIIAKFDKYTAKKNVYERNRSDNKGFAYKKDNVEQLPTIIKYSTYFKSEPESGKNKPAHKGVKEWHYFVNQIDTSNGRFDVVINIRDKGNEQFVYEVAIRKQKNIENKK